VDRPHRGRPDFHAGAAARLGGLATALSGLEASIVLPGALVIAAAYWLMLRRMTGPALAR
jgi:hypothetical protein